MTIDSTWLACFKSEAPYAFSPRAPFKPNAVFTDGQIRLMQGGYNSDKMLTWAEYVYSQFVRPLERFYEACDTVILAFDNYELVPPAKCMTQQKRRRHIPVLAFSDQVLPSHVPQNEQWMACIANRTFKSLVIEFVALTLPARLLKDKPNRKLIIDYQTPELYRWNKNEVERSEISGLAPMGEADVKFNRYADIYAKLQIDSIDGDSIPIALAHFEKRLQSGVELDMCVYRMEIKSEEEKKRKKQRTYEYVQISALHAILYEAVMQCTGRVIMPACEKHEIRMLVSLICLTGTDFSRNLPGVTGQFVFGILPNIWMQLAMAYNAGTGQLNVDDAAHLVASIYRAKYEKHLGAAHSIEDIYVKMQSSKLAARTKESFPNPTRIYTTVRNVNWVLQYWNGTVEDPIQPQFGYTQERGLTKYAD